MTEAVIVIGRSAPGLSSGIAAAGGVSVPGLLALGTDEEAMGGLVSGGVEEQQHRELVVEFVILSYIGLKEESFRCMLI